MQDRYAVFYALKNPCLNQMVSSFDRIGRYVVFSTQLRTQCVEKFAHHGVALHFLMMKCKTKNNTHNHYKHSNTKTQQDCPFKQTSNSSSHTLTFWMPMPTTTMITNPCSKHVASPSHWGTPSKKQHTSFTQINKKYKTSCSDNSAYFSWVCSL